MTENKSPLRIGVGGPVGSGKTALLDALCKAMRDDYDLAVVTNDIYTKEDAQFLTRSEALSADRIVGVETGGCPHTAIREDASMNLAAVEDLSHKFPDLDLVFIESGGDASRHCRRHLTQVQTVLVRLLHLNQALSACHLIHGHADIVIFPNLFARQHGDCLNDNWLVRAIMDQYTLLLRQLHWQQQL